LPLLYEKNELTINTTPIKQKRSIPFCPLMKYGTTPSNINKTPSEPVKNALLLSTVDDFEKA